MVLVAGFLLLDQFRADLIEARIQSLATQADIIAAAISASAAARRDTVTMDPDKLLHLAPGQSVAPPQSDEDAIQFSINPALVGPFLHRLVAPTRTRARIYDSDGRLLLDSRALRLARGGRPLRPSRRHERRRPGRPAHRRSAQPVRCAPSRRTARTRGSTTQEPCPKWPARCTASALARAHQ